MEKQGDKLSIRKGGRTEIFHKLTSRLVNIEAPSRKIFVEGKDSPFYELINKFLKNVNLVNDHFNLDIMPLPGGGKCGLRNKDTIITFMKSIEPDDVSEYDTIHSYYGIIDDDNDRLDINQKERKKYAGIKNLLVLKRYSHENYILDPVNIYFYFRCLKDNNDQINENAQNLLTEVEEKVKDITKFTQTVSEELLSFKIRNIYEEIQKPTKVAVEEIKNFLQIIINAVKEKVQKLNSEIDQIKKIIKKIEKKREEEGKKYKNILEQWIKSLSKLNTDAKESGYNQLQILLKSAYEVKEEVTVLGIKLEYPKFFTCFRGHDLNDLLMQDEIFTGVINCEEEKMIKKFEETDMGIFIPDEIIEIYKTICHNITYNKEMINKLKNKKKMRLFILDMKNSDDNEKFIQ